MLGRLNPQIKDVTIIGAGISGLLAAYYLDKEGYRITLVEAALHAGGLISTRKTQFGIAESAAHSVPATPTVRELFQDLGVELSLIRPQAKARWIYRHGKPRKFPLGPFEALGAFLRAYFVMAPARDPESLTLEEWTRRFLGGAALRYLVTPFVRGIYGASPKDILVSAAFPALCVPRGSSLLSFLLSKKLRKNSQSCVKRPLIKMPRGEMAAPLNGMQALTDALEKRLTERLGIRFKKGATVTQLDKVANTASNLVLCVPAGEAARLLSREAPELSTKLSEVRYSPLTAATVFLKKDSLAREPRGLGVLIPDGEGRRCLGVLYNSSSFPGRVKHDDVISLSMMLDESEPDSTLPALIESELNALFGLKSQPLEISFKRWEHAVPKYDAHLLGTWEAAEKTWCSRPGRILFGNYTGQVSIRGMAELARALSRTV